MCHALFTGALDYPVTVTVKESLLLSKKVFLKWYSSSPSNTNWLRSFNPGWWWVPMWMKYKGTSPIKYRIMPVLIHFIFLDASLNFGVSVYLPLTISRIIYCYIKEIMLSLFISLVTFH